MTDLFEDGIPGLGKRADDDADGQESDEDDRIAIHENGHDENGVAVDENGHDADLDPEALTGEPSAPDVGGVSADANEFGADADGTEADANGTDTDESEDEPVEVLVSLAKSGEIDPWDIDIVEVTDAFLDRLDETDLRTSGRALFYASVLLRMKSDELLAPEVEDEPEPEPWEAAMEGGAPDAEAPGFDPVDALESEMERRLDRQSTRGSPETLDELVRELREAERGSWWKESREYDTSGSPSGFDRGTQTLDYRAGDDVRADGEPDENDVTGTTHEEDIETVIDDVREILRTQYDAGREEVLFAELSDAGGTAVTTFLALLFLANRSEIRLQQDDIFGDLWVQDSNAPVAGDEAIAD